MPEQPDIPKPLTVEWIDWLSSWLDGATVDRAQRIIIEHCATEKGCADFWWHVRVADGSVTVMPGPAAQDDDMPKLIFKSDRETAQAIALGEESARRAFLEGQLHLSGDIRLLIAARPTLQALTLRPPATPSSNHHPTHKTIK